jgi:succinate-semialdehyde dehydrogenase/glutarate-semialdehyde dehydrogenase
MDPATRHYELFIDGAWRSARDGSTLPLINPATVHTIGDVACATAEDLDLALDSASKSQESWSRTPPAERGCILLRAAAILRETSAEPAQALAEEQGKTVEEARGEFLRAVETLEWNGEHAGRLCEPVTVSAERTLVPEAVGVVAAFTPWNYPAVLSARKLAAPLAAGCPVILKAAEETPGAAAAIVSALQKAGAPKGIVNLVFGEPAMISMHLLSSRIVKAVTFTGSTAVGRQLAALAAPRLQRCVLELGGHAAAIVFADCDLAATVQAISDYKFECAGQSCNAPSRIYVQEEIYEEFKNRLIGVAREIRVGAGTDPEATMGPMANLRRVEAMQRLTDDAVRRGAQVDLGGRRLDRRGYFWPPTVLTGVPSDALIMHEEPFGPILPINRFTSLDDVIRQANATSYGLAAYVFSRSEATIKKVIAGLETGAVSVNCLKGVSADSPYGGIKDSGYGYEGGVEGFRSFQNLKVVSRMAGA